MSRILIASLALLTITGCAAEPDPAFGPESDAPPPIDTSALLAEVTLDEGSTVTFHEIDEGLIVLVEDTPSGVASRLSGVELSGINPLAIHEALSGGAAPPEALIDATERAQDLRRFALDEGYEVPDDWSDLAPAALTVAPPPFGSYSNASQDCDPVDFTAEICIYNGTTRSWCYTDQYSSFRYLDDILYSETDVCVEEGSVTYQVVTYSFFGSQGGLFVTATENRNIKYAVIGSIWYDSLVSVTPRTYGSRFQFGGGTF